jgi:hypothetical protein
MIGNLGDIALREEQTLRSTEATERRVGHGVCLANSTPNIDIGDLIDTINVRQASFDDRTRQVLSVATVGEYVRIESKDLSLLGDTNLPMTEEGMALTRRQDILVTV